MKIAKLVKFGLGVGDHREHKSKDYTQPELGDLFVIKVNGDLCDILYPTYYYPNGEEINRQMIDVKSFEIIK